MDQAPAIRLVYMADPMCSWCWGFSDVLRQLYEEYADRLPFDVVMGGLRAGNTQPLASGQRDTILHHWSQVADHAGAEFQTDDALPPGFAYNTEPACRAVVTARHLDTAQLLPMLSAVQRAFYAQARDVTDSAVLTDIAAEIGLDRHTFANSLESEAMREAAKADFSRARDAGVNGYPALCLQRSWQTFPLFIGYQPLADARTVVERVLAKFG